MHKRTKALAIPKRVKELVHMRDGGCCILCQKQGNPDAHFIARSQSGLGIEQNIVTLCPDCHCAYDNSGQRPFLRECIREYLEIKYPDFTDEMRVYRKYMEEMT